ncbi:dipeptidase [Schinkia azotoformans]|uniref:Membrane dipeptidase n=1 Tax=Schinkia azotoformans LMG 9581 TaxID=1131731 RepID=K6DIC1_SCHAZ|nr:dipeptidase [Schinkia azotoformans]EKN68019.1 Membrane dipeptidase [Schinkia azotoformans LMG 9581]MEC1638176.1 dipeptidase [Schinkia azotoformans]MEC1946390.1 dipeptidase [Schinkia azotoformans]
MMKIFDAHCDVLYKMWLNNKISFKDSDILHVNYENLVFAGSKVQCFAIYIPESVRFEDRFNVALEMVDIFYERVLNDICPKMKLVLEKKDILQLHKDEIGAILTLEGCDAIGHDLVRLKTLYRLGVRSVGLTWNLANAVADGCREQRNGGLSNFGIEVVQLNNDLKMWTDVSHLSERSFWDTIELAQFPIASHSNVYSLFQHPRNLKDDQIKAIIEKKGIIGISFVPYFLSENYQNTHIKDILNHIDYICSLGGEKNIGFGSDFDGIDDTINGLEDYRGYKVLVEELQKQYSNEQISKFCYQNFVDTFPN